LTVELVLHRVGASTRRSAIAAAAPAAAGEQAAGEGAVGDDPDARLDTEGEHLPLLFAVEETADHPTVQPVLDRVTPA
jgi:hypothetical protein